VQEQKNGGDSRNKKNEEELDDPKEPRKAHKS
jgi:hypothetical protein